jgi:hypothetical protein
MIFKNHLCGSNNLFPLKDAKLITLFFIRYQKIKTCD